MIMQEQELTLFGGWAKALIPQSIEHGVGKPSDTPSVSIYINSEWQEEPISIENLFQFLYEFHIEIDHDESTKDVQVEAKKYCIINHLAKMEMDVKLEPTEIWVEKKDLYGNMYLTPSAWMNAINETWIRVAFFRFFEIWTKGTSDALKRATGATAHLERSFSGMIGGQNDRGGSGNGALTKLPTGEWCQNWRIPLYPRVHRLPPDGIWNAQIQARKMKEMRVKKNRSTMIAKREGEA